MQTVKFKTFHIDRFAAEMEKKHVNYTIVSQAIVTHPKLGFLVKVTEVSIEIPALNGWEFVAKIENVGGEFNLVTTPDSANESLSIPHRTKPISCSHCNTKRKRKSSFLLKKGDEVIEVGATCLDKYLNVSEEDIKWIVNSFEIVKSYSNPEDISREYPLRFISLQESMGTIYRVLANTVYVKKCRENEYPTSTIIWTMLTKHSDDITSERLIEIINRVGKVTESDEVEGQKLLESLKETMLVRLQEGHEKMSEFDYKLAVLLQSPYIDEKHFPTFIGGLHAYMARLQN
jgi:hypothetical protein